MDCYWMSRSDPQPPAVRQGFAQAAHRELSWPAPFEAVTLSRRPHRWPPAAIASGRVTAERPGAQDSTGSGAPVDCRARLDAGLRPGVDRLSISPRVAGR